METCGHWLPAEGEGKQGGSSNVHRSPGDGEAASRRAAALLLNLYGPLKESKNSNAVVTERYSIVPDLVYVGLQKYSELSNALGGLSAALGGLSQLFFYAKTKLGYLRTKPGHRGLSQTFMD